MFYGKKCIVKGCTNRVGEGQFIGNMCDCCYKYDLFLRKHKKHNEEHKALKEENKALKEENKLLSFIIELKNGDIEELEKILLKFRGGNPK